MVWAWATVRRARARTKRITNVSSCASLRAHFGFGMLAVGFFKLLRACSVWFRGGLGGFFHLVFEADGLVEAEFAASHAGDFVGRKFEPIFFGVRCVVR